MVNYPSPCDTCPKEPNCWQYKTCKPWLKRYRWRQKQINAYAEKVLPGFYERQQKEGKMQNGNESEP